MTKSRDITLSTKVHLVKAMVFPVVMYGCETVMKAVCQRIDTFELWCWRRLLRVPWTARRSNQSNLKKINTEYSLEGLMLKLKLQYFGHLMRRADSLEKTLMLGKIEGRRRRGWQRMRWLDGITQSMDMNFHNLLETVKNREAWHTAIHRVTKSQTWFSDWTAAIGRDASELVLYVQTLQRKTLWAEWKNSIYSLRRDLTRTQPGWPPELGLPASGMARNTFLLFRPPNLWHFVMPGRAD